MMPHTLYRLAPLAAALWLAGCAVGPDYQRPAPPLPAVFAEQATSTASAAPSTALPADWWTLFGDSTLNTLIDAGLRGNADLRSAIARVEQADAAAREAGAALLPNVDLQAASSNNALSKQTATWSVNSPDVLRARSAGLSLSYEIDVWGRVRRSNEAARASLLASRYARDAIRLSVAGLIASNYLNLRALDAQLAVTAESLKSRQDSAQLVQARIAGGLVSPLDQYQADGAQATLQAQQADLRRARALIEHQLALLTGQPGIPIAHADLTDLPLPPQPPTGLPASLIDARPDVREAEQRLIAANAGIGLAKAAYYPKFSLTGGLGSESKTLTDLFTAGAGTWSLGLGAVLPLLDFGRNSARVDQAQAINQQSLIAWQKTLETAYKEVRDALVSLREQGAAEAAQQRRVDNARKALDIAQRRYEAGYSAYLEVLDAQRSANDARLALITTRQARLSAAVELFKALGGGWPAS